MISTLISLLLGLLESFLFCRLAEYILTFRFSWKYRHIPIIAVYAAFTIWHRISLQLNSSMLIMSKIVNCLLVLMILCVCYANPLRQKLFTLLLYLLFCICAEGTVLLLALLPPFRISLHEIKQIPFVDIMFNFISRVLMLFFIETFGARFQHFNKDSTVNSYGKQMRIILIINAVNFYIILYFFSTEKIYSNIDYSVLMVSTVNILLVSLISTYMITKISRRAKKELEYKLALRQMEMENKLNENMSAVVSRLRSLRHDMNNHFNVMTGLIDQEEYAALKEYVSTLKEDASDADQFILLENKTLTVLLNNKLAKANLHNIQFTTKITTENLPLTDLDLCTLLGNMIDNAIEACLHVEDSPYINLSIHKKGSLLKILCENSYSKEPSLVKNRFLTTKQNSKIHGMGIQNMRHVTKKYNGEIDFHFSNGVFTTEVIL